MNHLARMFVCKVLGIHKWYEQQQSEYRHPCIFSLLLISSMILGFIFIMAIALLAKGVWTFNVWTALIAPILLARFVLVPQFQKMNKYFDGMCIHCKKVSHDATQFQDKKRRKQLREELLTNQAREEYNEIVNWGQNED